MVVMNNEGKKNLIHCKSVMTGEEIRCVFDDN